MYLAGLEEVALTVITALYERDLVYVPGIVSALVYLHLPAHGT